MLSTQLARIYGRNTKIVGYHYEEERYPQVWYAEIEVDWRERPVLTTVEIRLTVDLSAVVDAQVLSSEVGNERS